MGDVTHFVDPTGEVVEAPISSTEGLLRAGYTPATEAQAADFIRRDHLIKEYGTTGQAAIAGLEGAADALTLGASTWAEKNVFGVDPEGIKAREELHPVAHGIGTGVGILAPMLFTGGTSAVVKGGLAGMEAAEGAGLLARAAEYTAPALLSKAGGAATKVATRALENEGASALGQVLRKGAASATGGLVEGLGYATGDVIHQAQLDPDMTAEAMAAQIGLGGLLGGGLGGGLHLGGGALSAVAGKVGESELGAKLAGWLGEKEGQLNLKAAGAGEAELERARNIHGREELNALGREMGELGLVTPYSTPAKTLGKAEALQEKAGGEIRTLLQRVDAKATPDVLPDAAGLFQRARTELIEPLEANALRPHQQEAAGRLRSLVDGLEQKLASEARAPTSAATDALAGLASEGEGGIGADLRRALERVEGLKGELTGAPAAGVGRVGFEQLHELRSQLTDAISDLSGAAEPATQAFRSGLQSLRTSVTDVLGAAMERAGTSSKAWQQAERQYQVASLAGEFAEKGLERAKAANPFAPAKLLGTLQDIATNGLGSETLKAFAKDQAGQLAPGLLSGVAKGLREVLEDPELSPVGRALMSKPRLPETLNALTSEQVEALEEDIGPAVLDVLSWGSGGKGLGPVRAAETLKQAESRARRVSWLWHFTEPERLARFKLMTKAADDELNRKLLDKNSINQTFLLDEFLKEKIDLLTGKPVTIHTGGQHVSDFPTFEKAAGLVQKARAVRAEYLAATANEESERAGAAKAAWEALLDELKSLKLIDNRIYLSLHKDAMIFGLNFEPGIGTGLQGLAKQDRFARTFAAAAKTEEEMEGRRLTHELGHHLHDVAHLASLVRRAEGLDIVPFRNRLKNANSSYWRSILKPSKESAATVSVESAAKPSVGSGPKPGVEELPKPLTQYAMNSGLEYFAEAYTAYVFDPKMLRDYDPFGYRLVEDALRLAGVIS